MGWSQGVSGGFNVCHTFQMERTILLFDSSKLSRMRCAASLITLTVAGLLSVGVSTATASTTWNDAQAVTFGPGSIPASGQWADVWSVSCPTAGNCAAVGEFSNAATGTEGFTATSTNGVWQQAQPIVFGSGIASVNSFAATITKSVSCPSASFCSAVGSFRNATGGVEAFSTTFSNGSWSTAAPAVFGAGVQRDPRYATLNSVSCPATGSCVAVGQFVDSSGSNGKARAFTMTMTNGTWGQATPAVFPAGVNVPRENGMTRLMTVSCASAGNCTAGGVYDTATVTSYNPAVTTAEAFTMTMTNGSWSPAEPVQFSAGVQYSDRESDISAVSCGSPGNCVVSGGVYTSTAVYKGFTVLSTNGVWGTPQIVAFDSSVQGSSSYSYLYSASCSSAGNCVAVGEFENIPYGASEAFTMTLVNGVWGAPTPVSFGSLARKTSRDGYLRAVSCPSDGNCTAAGQFWDANNQRPSFTLSMTSGVWSTAIPVAFPAGLQSTTPNTRIQTVSCASAGNCVAGGYFFDNSGNGNYPALLVSSVNISVSSTTTTAPPVTTTVAPTTTLASSTGGTTTTTIAAKTVGSGSLPSTGARTFDRLFYAGFLLLVMGGITLATVRRQTGDQPRH